MFVKIAFVYSYYQREASQASHAEELRILKTEVNVIKENSTLVTFYSEIRCQAIFFQTDYESDFKGGWSQTQGSIPATGGDFTEPQLKMPSNQCSQPETEKIASLFWNRLHFSVTNGFSASNASLMMTRWNALTRRRLSNQNSRNMYQSIPSQK